MKRLKNVRASLPVAPVRVVVLTSHLERSKEKGLRSADAVMPSRRFLYDISIALFLYAWASVNIYLPILPELRDIFQTTPNMARLTVAIFLAGYAITQVVWGPLSDRFGRKPILVVGMAISCLGAALAGLTNDISAFTAARLLESIGLGVAPALARSLLTDTLDRPHVAIAMAYGAIAAAVMPALAPILGGYLDLFLTWRSIFFFLALYGAVLFVVCLCWLPETNKHKDPDQRPRKVFVIYYKMFHDRRYVGYLTVYGFAYGGVFGYYAAAPFIFITDLGYSSHVYGFLLIFNIVCYVLGVLVARLFIPRMGTDRIILYGTMTLIATSGLVLAMESYTTLSTFSVLLPMSVFLFGGGLISPAANAGAMTAFKEQAGAASALAGFSNALGGAAFSGALAVIHITRLWQLALYIAISALLCLACYWGLLRRRSGEAVG